MISMQVKLVSQALMRLQAAVMLQHQQDPEAEVGEAEATTDPEGQAVHSATLLPHPQRPLPPRKPSILCQPMLDKDGTS